VKRKRRKKQKLNWKWADSLAGFQLFLFDGISTLNSLPWRLTIKCWLNLKLNNVGQSLQFDTTDTNIALCMCNVHFGLDIYSCSWNTEMMWRTEKALKLGPIRYEKLYKNYNWNDIKTWNITDSHHGDSLGSSIGRSTLTFPSRC